MGTDEASATGSVADGVVDGVVDSPAAGGNSPADGGTGSPANNDKTPQAPPDQGEHTAETGSVTGDQSVPTGGNGASGDSAGGNGAAGAESAADVADAPTMEVSVPAETAAAPPPVTAPVRDAPSADQPRPAAADDVLTPPLGAPAPAEPWSRQDDWEVTTPHPGDVPPGAHDTLDRHDDEHAELDDEEWYEEYQDGALFAAIFSAPSLALAAFVFALTGLLGGMIPESLPYLMDPLNPESNPAFLLGSIMLGFAIIAASLGLAAMLRSIGSPLNWPRYLGGAAVLLALLMALVSVLLIVLAGFVPEQGGSN